MTWEGEHTIALFMFDLEKRLLKRENEDPESTFSKKKFEWLFNNELKELICGGVISFNENDLRITLIAFKEGDWWKTTGFKKEKEKKKEISKNNNLKKWLIDYVSFWQPNHWIWI